jgi:hypothetical protein
MPKPNVGASGAIASPFLSRILVCWLTRPPAATSTLGTARISSRKLSEIPGLAAVSPSMLMSGPAPVTRASVSAYVSEKRLENALSIVSVRT